MQTPSFALFDDDGGTTSSQPQQQQQQQELIYMYTTADKVTDATRIDELIETQRQQGRTVTAYRYQDSSHVGLLRDHPDDYARAIDTALQGAMERRRAK
jgi:dienelactone hydrolase